MNSSILVFVFAIAIPECEGKCNIVILYNFLFLYNEHCCSLFMIFFLKSLLIFLLLLNVIMPLMMSKILNKFKTYWFALLLLLLL